MDFSTLEKLEFFPAQIGLASPACLETLYTTAAMILSAHMLSASIPHALRLCSGAGDGCLGKRAARPEFDVSPVTQRL
jgi:hypothetical protein